MGYHQAGFDVYGVDIKEQPRYPFKFCNWDALTFPLEGFDAIHASPPCQRWADGTLDRDGHPDLLGPIRERLEATGVPWVMENVTGAPIRADFMLCGSMFDLPGLIRHRKFETSWHGFALHLCCRHDFDAVSVVGNGIPSGSTYYKENKGPGSFARYKALREAAMGIDWMTTAELSEAIPPAYTEWIGGQLMAHLKEKAA